MTNQKNQKLTQKKIKKKIKLIIKITMRNKKTLINNKISKKGLRLNQNSSLNTSII